MNIESFREFCLSLLATNEKMPFDQETLVFTVYDKIFALVNIEKFESFNVKCDPELAVQLREQYPAVIPGWHMNKKHWNTIILDGSLSDNELKKWIKHSYDMVVKTLPKKTQTTLANTNEL